MDSQLRDKAVNIMIRRQRRPDEPHGWVGLMALSKPRR
jgi:hypothetical protein